MSNVVQFPSEQKDGVTPMSREAIAIDDLLAHIIQAIRDDQSITVSWDRSAGRFVVESSAD